MSSVEDEIQNLDKRWDHLNKNMQTKLADIQDLEGQLRDYREEVKGADQRLSAVEIELNEIKAPVSDVEEMKKHIQKLEVLRGQLTELKPQVQSTLEMGQNLQNNKPEVCYFVSYQQDKNCLSAYGRQFCVGMILYSVTKLVHSRVRRNQ